MYRSCFLTNPLLNLHVSRAVPARFIYLEQQSQSNHNPSIRNLVFRYGVRVSRVRDRVRVTICITVLMACPSPLYDHYAAPLVLL